MRSLTIFLTASLTATSCTTPHTCTGLVARFEQAIQKGTIVTDRPGGVEYNFCCNGQVITIHLRPGRVEGGKQYYVTCKIIK